MKAPNVEWSPERGLLLHVATAQGHCFRDVPLRVVVDGHIAYYTWSGHEAGLVNGASSRRGEDVPYWAEAGFRREFFSGGRAPLIERIYGEGRDGFRISEEDDRAAVVLELTQDARGLAFALNIACASRQWRLPLPACAVELHVGGLDLGEDPHFTGSVSTDFLPSGRIAELSESGVTFHPIGVAGTTLPLVCLHEGMEGPGLRWEILCGDRPHLRVLPEAGGRAKVVLAWPLGRQIQPGQAHRFAGPLRVEGFAGSAVQALRDWRDEAEERYGMAPPPAPAWVRRALTAEVDLNPEHGGHAFKRLDDPAAKTLLVSLADMGYTLLYTVGHFNIGEGGWLSPIDYEPRADLGGREAERQFLAWAHELGMRVLIWLTTVGVDRGSEQAMRHPHRFTRRRDGHPYYAWGELSGPDRIGYAPDADPESATWREWLREQTRATIARGYDGIFLDGLLPRSDNHERATWPGMSRNGVDGQSAELGRFVRDLGSDLIYFPEDWGLGAQINGMIIVGRYSAHLPRLKRDAFRHDTFGGGGANPVRLTDNPHIAPEQVRHFLELRLASWLPGTLWQDMVEGYVGEAARPWFFWSMLAGSAIKTHSQYVEDPGRYLPFEDVPEPPARERETSWRLRGHAEFVCLLRFCRDEVLVRAAPRSQDGVEIEGDAAVIGLLRPTPERCLVALFQFANRPAKVRVRLAVPRDVPRVQRGQAGEPQARAWKVRERQHSIADPAGAGETVWEPGQALDVELGAYGYRLYELD